MSVRTYPPAVPEQKRPEETQVFSRMQQLLSRWASLREAIRHLDRAGASIKFSCGDRWNDPDFGQVTVRLAEHHELAPALRADCLRQIEECKRELAKHGLAVVETVNGIFAGLDLSAAECGG